MRNLVAVLLLPVIFLFSGCDSITFGPHKCVEITTREFGTSICQDHHCNGAGCFAYKCSFDWNYDQAWTMTLNGNVLIKEDVDCPKDANEN